MSARSAGDHNLPLAPESTAWDAGEAVKAMGARARRSDGSLNPAMMRQGFMLVDGDGSRVADYKLPFGDVIGGKLQAVPRAIFAAAARLDQVQGGGQDSARMLMEHYYGRMKRPTPWAEAANKRGNDFMRKAMGVNR